MQRLPWVSSRTLLFTEQGKYDLRFPVDCPALVHLIEFSSGHAVAPSYHDHLEISYVYSGRGRFAFEDRVYECAPGDVILAASREFHHLQACGGSGPKVISVHFMPEFVQRPGGPDLDSEYLRPFRARSAGWDNRIPAAALRGERVLDWILRIRGEIARPSPQRVLAVRTYLLNLLLVLARYYHKTVPDAGRQQQSLANFERLRNVLERMLNQYQEALPLREAAALACMSPAYFCRFFKRVTGHTLTDYQTRLRVDRATQLLLSTDLSVTEIAYRVGFASHSYFDRVFVRLTGHTPRQCRGSMECKKKSRP
jgi:AraC-like DNA-binding protein